MTFFLLKSEHFLRIDVFISVVYIQDVRNSSNVLQTGFLNRFYVIIA